ncbi:MAG: ABC transporter permease [Actinobacteria bacterium]|nr:ABC transporter permease [Actinomycetota bacterium]
MSTATLRQGSLQLIDAAKIRSRGALYVAEARIRIMMKWIVIIIGIAIANPVLYLISVGIGLGGLIDKSVGVVGVDGVKYLTFLAPALLAQAAIQGTMDETVYPTIEGFKWHKTFYSMNSTPLSGAQISIGVFLAAFFRTVYTVLLYFGVMWAFGALESPHAWLAIPTSIFAGASFGALMQAVAARLEDENFFFVVLGRFIMMPLFLFSGTFFPLTSMPFFLQWIGWVSPLWHATELGRYLTYGHAISSTMMWVHFLVLLTMLVSGVILSARIFTKRLAK